MEDIGVILTPLPKGFIQEALYIINANRSVRVPSTIPENGWEEEVSWWKPGESPLAPARDSESPSQSTPPHLFEQENPLSQPEGNIAASPSEPIAGQSLATEGQIHHHKWGLEVGDKEEKDEELRQKEKSNLEGHNEEQSPQRQAEEQKGDECGTYGEDSDTDGNETILRWLQGLRKERVGGKGHESRELEVVDEEETKKHPRQEERRNVRGHGEPHPSKEVGAEGVEKEAMDE